MPRLDANRGTLGVGSIYARHAGSADRSALVPCVIHDQVIASFHLGQVPDRNRIGNAVPQSFLVALEIGKGVSVRLGL
jgi:hypothetical protein